MELTHEPDRPARRIRRLLADDPRFEASTRWLQGFVADPEAKKVFAEEFRSLLAKHFPQVFEEEVPDEVRQPGLAKEVQGREVP